VCLVLISVVSYYCSILLIHTKDYLIEQGAIKSSGPSMSGGPAQGISHHVGVGAGVGPLDASVSRMSESNAGTNDITPSSTYAATDISKAGKSGSLSHSVTFQELGLKVFGQRGKWAIEAGICVSQVSFVCAYFLFIGDNVAAVVNKDGIFGSGTFYTLIATVAAVPLVYLKSIKKLVPAAILADVIIIFGLGVIFAYDFITIDRVHETVSAFTPSGLPLFFGIAVFAFEGINIILPVEQSMEDPKKFSGVLRQSYVHLTVVMILLGALSYSAFGESTQTPILFSLPDNDLVKSVQIMYSIALFFSVPLQMVPAFNIMESYPFYKNVFGGNMYVFRLLVIVAAGGIASVIPNFGLFLNLIGAVAGTATAFILPSMLYMTALDKWHAWRPLFCLIFGSVGGLIAFIVSCIEFAEG